MEDHDDRLKTNYLGIIKIATNHLKWVKGKKPGPLPC